MYQKKYAAVLLTLCVLAPVASALDRCAQQSSRARVEQCYQHSIAERKEALEEFHEAVLASTNIPPAVKQQVSKDYQSFMKNIVSFCPDSACVDAAMLEHIRDMYKEVNAFTVPQPAHP